MYLDSMGISCISGWSLVPIELIATTFECIEKCEIFIVYINGTLLIPIGFFLGFFFFLQSKRSVLSSIVIVN